MSQHQPTSPERGAATEPARRPKSDEKRERLGDSATQNRDQPEKAPQTERSTHGSHPSRAPNRKDEARDSESDEPLDDVDPKHRPAGPRR